MLSGSSRSVVPEVAHVLPFGWFALVTASHRTPPGGRATGIREPARLCHSGELSPVSKAKVPWSHTPARNIGVSFGPDSQAPPAVPTYSASAGTKQRWYRKGCANTRLVAALLSDTHGQGPCPSSLSPSRPTHAGAKPQVITARRLPSCLSTYTRKGSPGPLARPDSVSGCLSGAN